MSLSSTVKVGFSGQGFDLEGSIAVTADMGIEPVDTVIPAATAMATWAKTDANTASGTLAEGHGLATGTYDVYWTGGVRYGVAVTITTNAVALEGGAGTDFPASDTAVNISEQISIPEDFDGDDLLVICAKSDQRCHLSFLDSGTAVLKAKELTANMPWLWFSANGDALPITGNAVASVKASNGSTTAASLKMAGLQNAIT
jgi:hypothetical protein